MAYVKTVWKDRVVERPRTFKVINNADGTITLTPSEGTIIETGTPIIAQSMNKIENGISDLYNTKIVISVAEPSKVPEAIWFKVI